MDTTTKERIKEIIRQLRAGEITADEASDLIDELCDGGATTQGDGPPVGGGGGTGPGGGNP